VVAEELFRDTFWPVCSPQLFARAKRVKDPQGLARHTLVHCYWSPSDREAPTWERWLAAARSQGADLPALEELKHLSFREELHAIEAVIAGQGIAICSDVLVARELAMGVLVKALNLALPGYGFISSTRPIIRGSERSKPFRAGSAQFDDRCGRGRQCAMYLMGSKTAPRAMCALHPVYPNCGYWSACPQLLRWATCRTIAWNAYAEKANTTSIEGFQRR
jgi:DNA-binding transcriptional LysR family regulator